jgi:hypothetical protein
VHYRKRQASGPKCFDGEAKHDSRVLAAGEQQHRSLGLGYCFPDYVDRLGFESLKMNRTVARHTERLKDIVLVGVFLQ